MTNVSHPVSPGWETLLIFVLTSYESMLTILSIVVMIMALSMAVFLSAKNYRAAGEHDVRAKVMPRILSVVAVLFFCGLFCGSEMPFRFTFDMLTAVMSMYVPVLSIVPEERIPAYSRMVIGLMSFVSVCHILCAARLIELFPDHMYLALAAAMAFAFGVFFILQIWKRIRDVKSVIKSGNVWSFVTLCVDVVYVSAPFMALCMLIMLHLFFPGSNALSCMVMPLVLLEMVAIGLKILYDSAFVVMHDHERLIVESMKISRVDSGVGGEMRGEDQYEELYERILFYFEASKPYLDGDLTINDVVRVVYSNKVYISKAICHYTGRNFRQFVNYYRVMHSMDLFRNNLEFKVTELAAKSGFNNLVSYTMAFRLFMNETPSEWCRKERAKILKPKK